MAFRNRLFSLRLLVSRPEYRAVSLFRARQADSGQNEGKEFSRGGFFGTTRNKGAWFGFEKERDERGVCCPRTIFPQSLEFRGGRGSIKCRISVQQTWMTRPLPSSTRKKRSLVFREPDNCTPSACCPSHHFAELDIKSQYTVMPV